MLEIFSLQKFLLLCIVNLSELFGMFMILNKFFEKREFVKNKKYIIPIVFWIIYALMLLCNLQGIAILNLASAILAYVIPTIILTNFRNIKGWVGYIFFTVFCMLIEGMGAAIVQKIPTNRNHYDILEDPIITLSLALLEFIVAVLFCNFSRKNKENKENVSALTYMLFPIVTAIIYFIKIYENLTADFARFSYISNIVVGFILLGVNLLQYILLEKASNEAQERLMLAEQKISLQAESEMMAFATNQMKERLALTEESMERDRLFRHDRRHFEGILLALIKEGKYDDAEKIIEERLQLEPRALSSFCDNSTVNAEIVHYVNIARNNDIDIEVSANIPSGLKADDLELAIAIGNLLENAIHGCEKVADNKYIKLKALYKNQLMLEVENSCNGQIEFDDEGFPVTKEQGHGIGTKSVKAFIEKNQGTINYTVKDNIFRVRMIVE